MKNYEFPVAMEPVYTGRGNIVPGVMSIVRKDTFEPISAVSTKYRLIPHSDVVRQASSFLQGFGVEPQEQAFLTRSGAKMLYSATYKSNDPSMRITKGDVVGLRVFIENSYNKSSSVSVRIGFLVLSCLNGMVADRNVFYFSCRHTKKAYDELRFPDPAQIIDVSKRHVQRLQGLTDIAIKPTDAPCLVQAAQSEGLLSDSGAERVMTSMAGDGRNAWDLMQACTHHTTHTSSLSSIGQINRLERIDRWFSEMFHDGGYARLIERSAPKIEVVQ